MPIDCKRLSGKWVLVSKSLQAGRTRLKVCLVAEGYFQSDPGETFAPVAQLTTLRMLLALAARNQGEMDQIDLVTSFLNPIIDKETFMTLPEGTDRLELELETCKYSVCKLNKDFYRLKHSLRLGYHYITSFFNSIGFLQFTNDLALYVRCYIFPALK